MLNQEKLRVLAAWSAILATPLAVGHMALLALAGDFSNPLALLSSGAAAAQTLRWSMVLDIFGYYLLLVPAIVFLWLQLKSKGAHISGFAISGLLYVLAGAGGAAILAYANYDGGVCYRIGDAT